MPGKVFNPIKGVFSFNGRKGFVMPQKGDYTASMVGAAPAGFGLGTNNPQVLNTIGAVDSFINSGWASVRLTDGNYIANVSANGTLLCSAGAAYRIQCFGFFYALYGGYVELRRIWFENEWKEWEWVNPPMQLGDEYRTIERYNGKPVYAKAVNFGKLPNSTSATVSHGSGNVLTVISGNLVNQDGTLLNRYDAIVQFTIGRTDIVVRTTADMSSNICTVNMKYIKTTD